MSWDQRTVVVSVDGYRSTVRGWPAAGLVRRITGRHPVYLRAERAYSVSEKTAREVLALAEAEGFTALLAHRPAATEPVAPDDIEPVRVTSSEATEDSLW